MKRLSLDASFIIDFLKDRDHATEFYNNLDDPSIILSTLAKLEVKTGSSEIGQFERLETLSFDEQDIEEALEIISFLEDNGKMINKLDILIAAQTSNSGAELIATDKDFEKLRDYEGLKLNVIR